LTFNVTFFSIFSSPGFSLKWLKTLIKNKETIIHIHNWFNLISIKQLQKIILLGIPIVITLHDERLITGGCHYSLDCGQFHTACKKCPKINPLLRHKVRKNSKELGQLFNNSHKNLKLATPSNFMVRQALRSSIMKSQNVIFLPNPIPNYIQSKGPRDKIELRSTFRVGVASANPYHLIKGGDLIIELEQYLEANSSDIEIVYLANFPSQAHFDFWNSLDCLLVPSRADNSPNVIHEAKQFGLPIIATSVGGIAEVLYPEMDIPINISKLSINTILHAINEIKSREYDDKTIKQMQKAYLEYVGEPANKVIQIYLELLSVK